MTMRILVLLLSLVVTTWAFWEPRDLPCLCTGAGTGVIKTYDEKYKSIVAQQKTLLSAWGFVGDTNKFRRSHQCRFTVRSVTSFDILGDFGELYIDWVALTFDQKRRSDNGRSVLFGQCDHTILERGRGIKKGAIKTRTISPPYFYGRPGFFLFVWKDNGVMKLRSDTCPIAFNWIPNGRDTSFALRVGELYMDGSMRGMCGDCNGDELNDNKRCDNNADAVDDNPIVEISESCIDGDHQPIGISGSSKINCTQS